MERDEIKPDLRTIEILKGLSGQIANLQNQIRLICQTVVFENKEDGDWVLDDSFTLKKIKEGE